MASQKPRRQKRSDVTEREPPSVIFRLAQDEYEKLERRANSEGVKVNALARDLVLQSVDSEAEEDDLSGRLAGVEGAVNELRESMSFAVEGLLLAVTTGKPMPPEKVKDWVRSVFKLPGAS